MSLQFYQKLRKDTDELWDKVHSHPFVKEIGAGTLDPSKFVFYLKQDYLYLIEFSRVFGLASVKAQNFKDMAYFAELLNLTLNTEMELHRRTCADFGITDIELENTPQAMITAAYTDFLIRTCYEGSIKEIITILTPCAVGYVEIAQKLKEKGLPDHPHYREWIELYSAPEFVDYADMLIEKLNTFAVNASENDKALWQKSYTKSARFELLFFEMSWKKELWSTIVE